MKSIFFVLALLFPHLVLAINFNQPVTLQECIDYARENSPSAKIAHSSHNSRQAGYTALRADYLPQLRFSGSAPGLVREINEIVQPDGSKLFLPQSQLFGSGNLSIQQKVALTGGDIFVSSGLSRIDVLEPNEFHFWKTTPIQLTIRQPILQFNSYYWNTKIDKKRFSVADNRFVEDMEDIALNVTRLFFDVYLAQMNLLNAEQNVASNDTLYTLSVGRYDVGRIAENDLLQNELALLNSQYAFENAQLDYKQAIENFAVYLGIDKNIYLELVPPLEFEYIDINDDTAVAEAMNNRSDITDFEVQQLEAERNLKRTQSENRFNAVLSASFGMNQTSGNIDEAYKNLLDQERVNINIEVPIFRWGLSNARYQEALEQQISLEHTIENRLKNLEVEIKYQTLRFNQLQQQVSLSAKADTIANRRFEVAKNRYIIGKIDLNTFYIAQTEKDNALRSYINTLQRYWMGYYNLRRLTLYDFKAKRRLNINDYR